MRKFSLHLTALTLILAAQASACLANPLLDTLRGGAGINAPIDSRFNASPARDDLTAREAIGIAEQRYGGRAVGARAIDTANGRAYRVRILQDNGKIRNVVIDNK